MKPFDEMHDPAGRLWPHYETYARWLEQQPMDTMRAQRAEAELIFRRVGITFAVYGAKDEDGAGTERLIPFDLIPRIIPSDEWRSMEAGLRQRVTALNRFIEDVYHGQEILKAGIVPAEQVLNNSQYRPEMAGVDVSFLGAAGAGMLSFLSPCVLPLVPAYLCFLGGVSVEQLSGEGADTPAGRAVTRRVLPAAFAFVLGSSTVFVALGASASWISGFLLDNKLWLGQLAGIIIILFGLHFLG